MRILERQEAHVLYDRVIGKWGALLEAMGDSDGGVQITIAMPPSGASFEGNPLSCRINDYISSKVQRPTLWESSVCTPYELIHVPDPAVRRMAIWFVLQVIACPAPPARLNAMRIGHRLTLTS